MCISGEFKVIRFISGDTEDSEGVKTHDIVLKNIETDFVWLHSKQYVVQQEVKEVTAEQMMRDLKEKYGCEVKVTE
jgi:hypothetical protein